MLNFEHAKMNDTGHYLCRFSNMIGFAIAEFYVEVISGSESVNHGIVSAVIISLVLVIILLIILGRKIHKDKVIYLSLLYHFILTIDYVF
jgi:hypothetical protein